MADSMKMRLGEMLVDEGIITPEQLQEALQEQKTKGGRLEMILITRGYVTQDVIMAFVGTQLGIPHVSLTEMTIPADVIAAVPDSIAVNHCLIPVYMKDKKLTVAMADPLNVFAIDDVKMMTGFDVEPAIASEADIKAMHTKYYGANAGHKTASSQNAATAAAAAKKSNTKTKSFEEAPPVYMDQLLSSMGSEDSGNLEVVEEQEDELDIASLESAGEDAPVVRVVNFILTEAVRAGASDIHIEPYEKNYRCRYRIDGVLHEVKGPPKSMSAAVSSRLKIMSSLDIAERRLPQDGRIKIKVLGKEIDLRVSICPVQFGEKIVMRILDSSNLSLDIPKLGFEDGVQQKFEKAIREPYGLVLVTGPTGSGKSTTLYSALHAINDPDTNISTIEDPVEYNLPGINQVNAKAGIGLTFAAGLRSFLRQDPDVVMVGEIRDKETAEIAINAALTGHLVFSTLHTNDAPGAVTRMGNMGVEPFLITSTVHCVVAQRLLRRICKNCKESYVADPEILKEMDLEITGEEVLLYKGKGCSACADTGYKGRMAIHEVMILNDDFRKAVIQRKPAAELKAVARAGGMQTLRECGVQKVLKGLTSVEELFRVAHGDD
jgi:type IV pilus assembly protein PilB